MELIKEINMSKAKEDNTKSKSWFEKCLDRIEKGKTPFKKSK